MTAKRDLEATMLLHIRANELPAPECEYQFHPRRKWRFDFAYPEQLLALEVQGGIHMAKGGHNTAAGITRDCEKGNEAVVLGWRVLHVTAAQIDDGSAIDWLRRSLAPQGVEAPPF